MFLYIIIAEDASVLPFLALQDFEKLCTLK